MKRYAEAARLAYDLTDEQSAKEIAALVPFNLEKVQELLPQKRDKGEFLELMKKVEDETEMDKKLAYLETNVKTLGPAILKILRGFL